MLEETKSILYGFNQDFLPLNRKMKLNTEEQYDVVHVG
jgi:hypothetical protein